MTLDANMPSISDKENLDEKYNFAWNLFPAQYNRLDFVHKTDKRCVSKSNEI